MLIQSLELVLFDYRLFPAEMRPDAADGPIQTSPGWVPTDSLAALAGTTAPNEATVKVYLKLLSRRVQGRKPHAACNLGGTPVRAA